MLMIRNIRIHPSPRNLWFCVVVVHKAMSIQIAEYHLKIN